MFVLLANEVVIAGPRTSGKKIINKTVGNFRMIVNSYKFVI